MHDEDQRGCPSIVNDDLVEKVNSKICENFLFTISELSMCFPQTAHKLLYETVVQSLHYHEVCARWVPKILMHEQKSNT